MRIHDFKHLILSIFTSLSFIRCYKIIRQALEKIRSGLADIGGIERILIAMR